MKSVRQLLPYLCAVPIILTATSIQAEPLSRKASLSAALAGNPLIAESRLGVEAGKQGVVSAEGKHYPRINLDGTIARRQDPIPFVPAQSATIGPHFSDSFASYTLQMTIPFYQGGQVVNGVKLAEVRRQLQEDSLILTRNDIIANTVNTYNKLLQTQKFRESSQASVNALEEQRKNAQLLYDTGRIARVDLLKVEVQLANDKQRLFTLDEALANLGATLRYLMGEREEGILYPLILCDTLDQPEFSAEFTEGLVKAHQLRPEYRIAQKTIQEAGLNRSAARGKLLPSVNGFAGYLDQFGFDPSYKEANWFVGINVSMPLFDKSLSADVTRERIQLAKSEQRLLAVDNQIRLDIRTALSSLQESRNRIAAATKATEQAHESFRIEQEKYKSGAGAMVDLLLAQAADLTAAANVTQALFDYNVALVAWRKATGTLEDYLK